MEELISTAIDLVHTMFRSNLNPQAPQAKEQKIGLAYTFLSMSSCQAEASTLQRCAQLNRIPPDDEARLLKSCPKEVQGLNQCMEKVDQQVIFENLAAIAGQSCPERFERLEECARENGNDLSSCQYEWRELMACGSDKILNKLQGSQ